PQVQLLEAELKQHFLRRTGRGAEPPEAGLRLLEHARSIHKLATHAKQDLQYFRVSVQGKVRLGIPPGVARRLTPHIVQQSRTPFPNPSITIAEGLSTQLREDLFKDKVDLALLYDPPHSGVISYESIHREELVLAYPLGRRPWMPA